jgi:hypothetical protein
MAKQRSFSASFDSETEPGQMQVPAPGVMAVQPAAAAPEMVAPGYDNTADTNMLQQYIDAMYPAKEKKKEEHYRRVAMANASGNILRSFFDAIGAAKGAPVTPLNNDKYTNQYHQIMNQNMQRQDRVNQYMLQETARKLAQGEAWKREDVQTAKAWNREDGKIADSRTYAEGKLKEANSREDAQLVESRKYTEGVYDKQNADRKAADERNHEQNIQMVGVQGAENRKTQAERFAVQAKYKQELLNQKTDKDKFELYATVNGRYQKVKDVDEGELNIILADILDDPQAKEEYGLMGPLYGQPASKENKKALVSRYWNLVHDKVVGPESNNYDIKNPNGLNLPSFNQATSKDSAFAFDKDGLLK